MGTLLIPIMGLPALPPQKRKEKNFRQLNCYYKLWIIIFGSFFAPSLCHLPDCQERLPCSACANPLPAHGEAQLRGKAPVLVWERGSFSCIGTPFDGQLYLLRNERGTEQCSSRLLPLHAVSLEAWGWPAGLSTRLRLRGLYHLGALT